MGNFFCRKRSIMREWCARVQRVLHVPTGMSNALFEPRNVLPRTFEGHRSWTVRVHRKSTRRRRPRERSKPAVQWRFVSHEGHGRSGRAAIREYGRARIRGRVRVGWTPEAH